MTVQKTELKVFVASPGGVASERDAVVDLAARLNATLGDLLDVTITVKRYEYISGRAGAPQKQIDPWVDDCDVFIAILHRRWGSPPDEEFDSGFAEEFDRALKRWEGDQTPSIAVYFKTVDVASVADPGPQLEKVLEFRNLLEGKRLAFYSEFEETRDFTLLVQQLLVEEMHKAGRIGATGAGYSPAKAGAEREEEVNTDKSNDTGIASMFSRFANALTGTEIDGPLDFDRLELFALSVSRDDEDIPTHLANRLVKRDPPLVLSILESDAWFTTYAADIGRVTAASERVVPFPSRFGGSEKVKSLAGKLAIELLSSDRSNQRIGVLRILTTTLGRPKSLWPTGDLTEEIRVSYTAVWANVKTNAELSSAVTYWMSVGSARDLRLARILASASDENASKLGAVLVGLLPKAASADPLASADPTILLEPIVAARFADGNPFKSVSTDTLTTVVGRPFLGSELCAACLVELLRRDEVPASTIKAAINEKNHEEPFEDAWPPVARRILFDTPATAQTLTKFLDVLSGVEDKDVSRLIVARIAASSPEFRTSAADMITRIIETARDPASVSAQLLLIEDAQATGIAEQLIDGRYQPAQAYVEALRAAGANDMTLGYVTNRFSQAGLRYLAPRAKGALRGKVQRLLRFDRDGNALRQFESAALLANCFATEDVEFLIENLRYSTHDRKSQIARFLGGATVASLRRLLSSTTNDVPMYALRELARRGRLPSFKALVELLRSPDADLRMTALDILLESLDDASIEKILRAYWDHPGTFYYNVVCELDQRLAGIPPYVRLVAL